MVLRLMLYLFFFFSFNCESRMGESLNSLEELIMTNFRIVTSVVYNRICYKQ